MPKMEFVQFETRGSHRFYVEIQQWSCRKLQGYKEVIYFGISKRIIPIHKSYGVSRSMITQNQQEQAQKQVRNFAFLIPSYKKENGEN
jgi:hypothetical protein